MTAWILLLVVVLLILLNALFVAVEFSYLTVNRNTVRRRIDEGDRLARLLEAALTRTSSNLSGAQLGITLTSLVAGYLLGPSLGTLLTDWLGLAGMSGAAATGIAMTAAFVIGTFTQMVVGELVPKNWAVAAPLTVSRLVVVPQNVFMFTFGWLVKVLNGSANVILRALGFTPAEEVGSARTADELLAVVARSGQQGTLDRGTAELAARSIEFGDRTAADVMRPRPQVAFLDTGQSVQELLQTSIDTGHSRFPVQGDSVDEILGFAHYKHALGVPVNARARTSVQEITRPPLVVSEAMTLDPLMRRLREPGLQIAVVIDEYGGTAGIVTLEDLMEEIIGDIHDEQDVPTRRYRPAAGGGIVVSGLLRPDELGDIVGLALPDGEVTDTLGGLISEHLDRLPITGDTVRLDAVDEVHRDADNLPTAAQLRLRVLGMDAHRVDRVLVLRLPTREDPRDPDSPLVTFPTAAGVRR